MNKNPSKTLITGASSGIGYELAREFARHRHSLILVAQDEEELAGATAAIYQESGVEVEAISCDLRDADQIDELLAALAANGSEIEILCNNAGVGFRGHFWETTEEDHLSVIHLNVEAVIRLTRALLPPMIARGHGRILNTASVAGYQPGPMMAVYHASKAFILSFSESLATELEDTEVTVTALCPGPTDTEFFPKADMVETKAFQKANLMAPQEVAEAAYKALMAGERDIIPGGINKAMVFSRRFLSDEAQTKANAKMYEEVDPEDHQREPGEIAAKAEAKRNK